ncbi:hypothetical protein JCM8202_000793 [Rhodotorula sphaerocarpa]
MRAQTTYNGLSKRVQREPRAVGAERDSVVASPRLPDDVKARISYWVEHMHGTCALLPLSAASKSWRRACVALLFQRLDLCDGGEIVRAQKCLGSPRIGTATTGPSLLQEIKELALSVRKPFAAVPPRSALIGSLSSICGSATNLTSLSIGVGAVDVSLPVTDVFPTLGSDGPLGSLAHLRHFHLEHTFIWLHELVKLGAGWSQLETLILAHLRGNCACSIPSKDAAMPCRLRELGIQYSSLTNEMTAYLLRGQTRLEHLSIPVQELTGAAFDALKKVMPSLLHLDLRDAWAEGKQIRRKTTKDASGVDKPNGETGPSGEGVITATLPPLFRLLEVGGCPGNLHLNRTVVPSDFLQDDTFSTLAACMLEVETLILDDFSATSLVCEALADSLVRKELPFLQRIKMHESAKQVATKKLAVPKGVKALEAACEVRKITLSTS